jgi:hypothetical protein
MPPEKPFLLSLKGGLGNQLFQLGSVWSLTKNSVPKRDLLIKPAYPNKHSAEYYFDNLFKAWSDNLSPPVPPFALSMNGYYQDYRYINPEFLDQLNWTGYDDSRGYDDLDNSLFIHVRGGDYLQPGFREIHNVDMTEYYKRAVKRCDGHAYLFTNDRGYYESLDCLADVRHTVVDSGSEIKDLWLMSQCLRGGIAPNSTFSWWGLYLDRKRPLLCLPDTWFLDRPTPGASLFFPEATVLPCV